MQYSNITINVIGFSNLLMTPVLYIICLIWQNNEKAELFHRNGSTLLVMAASLSLICLVLSGVMLLLKNKLPGKLQTSSNPIQTKMTHAMIVLSICEIPAIFGFALFILSGNMNWFYAFAGYSMLLFAYFWPRGAELPSGGDVTKK
ncbi:MAG: hypothetical protein LWY06_07135 [Firmicutes bacterium]|nr:hypothetical protein [Bacillota bacterium]